jgi:exosortase/archaeosortase family protein
MTDLFKRLFASRARTAAAKMALWLFAVLIISLALFRSLWAELPGVLSLSYVLDFNVSPWAILLLCLLFLVLKRHQVALDSSFKLGRIESRISPIGLNLVLAALIIVGAAFIPDNKDLVVLRLLLVGLGAFVLVFGPGGRIPAILVAVYAFAMLFPAFVDHFLPDFYAGTAGLPSHGFMTLVGLPIQYLDQNFSFSSVGGEPITVLVTTACAGPFTMSIFISIFALMMLDRPLPLRHALAFFLFGVLGTWLQNVIRLVILVAAGYELGSRALWDAHYWSVYILFPLWYLLFAYLYLRQSSRIARKADTPASVS